MIILHLSDLHIQLKSKGRTCKKTSMLINGIINKYQNKRGKIVIVITGDIVHWGNINNHWEKAKSIFSIFNLPHIKNKFTLLMCPGNHDYGANGLTADVDNMNKIHSYLNKPISFPTHKPISDDNNEIVHFIGIDSMQGEKDFNDDRIFAQGIIGNNQLNNVRRLIRNIRRISMKEKIVLYLHHHPWYDNVGHLLIDHEKFVKLIESFSINAVLFGHEHKEQRFEIIEKLSNTGVIFASGKSTDVVPKVLYNKNVRAYLPTTESCFRIYEINIWNNKCKLIQIPV